MEAPKFILTNGTKIKTHHDLGSTTGLLVTAELLQRRKSNTEGTIKGVVPGHGGDVYWVVNDDGSKTCYCWTEFELVPCPSM